VTGLADDKESAMADSDDTTGPGGFSTALQAAAARGEDYRAFGPVAAAFLAAGIGVLVLGVMTTIAEARASFADKLAWSDSVGPLSGKTIVAVGAWIVSWIVLHVLMRKRDPAPALIFTLTGILLALGFLGTLPTFFDKFAPS
jgi:hypothetical protein